MKKGFFLSTIALLSLGMLAGCGGGEPAPTSQQGSSAEEKVNVGEIKVWCDEAVIPTATAQTEAFKAAHPNYDITFKIEPKSESSAAGDMISDPDAGADVYFFAQDQLARLVNAKAIATVPTSYVQTVTDANDAASISAGTVGGKLYAYPATSDNTYFMYYNKADMEGVDLTDFSAIIAKAKEIGKTVYYEAGSAWYNAAFFYGAGAHSEWTVNDQGHYTAYDDTYNSTAGQVALKGMHELFKDNTVFVDSSENGAFNKGACVLVSGTWAKKDVQDALGENMGATILPKYTVDGQTYQLKSFGGYKLVGTKAQNIVARSKAVAELAMYLTNEASQLERFTELGWGPSNKAAQQSDAIKNDVVLTACFAQMQLSTPQGQYPGDWWNHAGGVGKSAYQAEYNPAEILSDYEAGLDAFLDE